MTELPKTTREPFFLDWENRRLFSIYHSPGVQSAIHGGAVFFAPFAEEANRTRKMATLLAEALSNTGTATLLFDYSSTGDSSGDFCDARWDRWVSDGCAAIDWLHKKIGKPVSLVGLRLGGLLALECARKTSLKIPQIALWQPPTSGRTLFTQFLRIRLAASLAEGGDKETTKALMERFANGEVLEVAGYRIAPALAEALDGLKISELAPPKETRVLWYEVTTGDNHELMPPSQKTVAAWRDAGLDIASSVISGEQFWATQEIATAPPLIHATRDALTPVPA